MTASEARPAMAGTVPWPDDVARRYVAAGLWTGEAVGTRLRAAADAGTGETALVDGAVRLSHGELWARADGAAERLARLGLRPGDRILLQLPNRWEFVVLLLACLRLGVPPVMALPPHRGRELAHLAARSGARAIAVPDALDGHDHQETAHRLGLEHVLVAGRGIRPGGHDLAALCRPAGDPEAARRRLDASAPDGRAVAVFLLSGGTTGLPKLIPRTHDDWLCGMRHGVEVCRFDEGTVYLAVLPAAHNYTLAGPGLLGALLAGGRAVLASSPDPARALPLIEREGVTVTSVVPAVAQRWIEYRRARPGGGPTSLRTLQVGGARLSEHVARQVRPVLGCAVQQGYGMAEGLICFTRPDDPEDVACTTQGRPICPADELLVVDERGRPVPPGEPGVLLTRGPYTLRGYYRAEEHNARAFTPDGWYRTGDVVRRRPDGNLVVEGREKDMINRAGEKISAEEVEDLARLADGVREAAAVAMPDPVLGERVCLYVVPEAGAAPSLRDVVAAMERAEAARLAFPERLVLVGALPVTDIGKVDKAALRADIARRIAGEPGRQAPDDRGDDRGDGRGVRAPRPA
ncbi:(2,3-dihydroxybenzoyl)adenylate synthase [Actinomadura sediminis]|uniref:(2,3-dihydroxybenzoyl)adenylate synthase n=1 Tax=Actinomadura sediminis TaxID=1038904 RepID=A0ABW3EWA4_9ACTN